MQPDNHRAATAIWPPDAVLVHGATRDAAEMFHGDWSGVDPVSDQEAARHFLFHDCDTETREWALTTLRSPYPVVSRKYGAFVCARGK